jgi:hypothetical protein
MRGFAAIMGKALTSNKISTRVLKWLVAVVQSRLCLLIFYFLDLPNATKIQFNTDIFIYNLFYKSDN